MITAFGVAIDDEKVAWCFVQAKTENDSICMDFLKSLLERGLKDRRRSALSYGW